jgi:hypothetical protein
MSLWRTMACAALAGALATACGGEKKGGAEKEAPAPAAVKDGQKAPAEAAEPAAAAGEKIPGKATQASEGGPGAETALELALASDGRVGGSLSLGSATCSVSGMLEEAVVRAWLDCPAAGGAAAKRGALVGEVAGGKYQGTFAASDDGAAIVVHGTWTAGK